MNGNKRYVYNQGPGGSISTPYMGGRVAPPYVGGRMCGGRMNRKRLGRGFWDSASKFASKAYDVGEKAYTTGKKVYTKGKEVLDKNPKMKAALGKLAEKGMEKAVMKIAQKFNKPGPNAAPTPDDEEDPIPSVTQSGNKVTLNKNRNKLKIPKKVSGTPIAASAPAKSNIQWGAADGIRKRKGKGRKRVGRGNPGMTGILAKLTARKRKAPVSAMSAGSLMRGPIP